MLTRNLHLDFLNVLRLILLLLIFNVLNSSKAQTFHVGVNSAYSASFLFNKSISTAATDTEYVFTGSPSFGITSAFYFDFGGYYHRKIYGIKLEAVFAKHNQNIRVFPGDGASDPNIFYMYKIKLNLIDIPLLFTLCSTHHQGVAFEIGPQVSFLQNVNVKLSESRVDKPPIPVLTKSNFQNVSFSGVIGLGLFYSFSEKLALSTTIRGGYGFSDLTRNLNVTQKYFPTHRFWTGINVQFVYKINKYDTKRNRGYKYYLKHSRRSN